MQKTLLLLTMFIFSSSSFAQTPQFAVVRPNGTTFICPTFDSAYNKASNDDYIYLPGGYFSITNPIGKRLHIYGAGYNIDSSIVTGNTIVDHQIKVLSGGSGGSLTGIYSQNSLIIHDTVNGYTISRCHLSNITIGNGYNAILPSNITITETALTISLSAYSTATSSPQNVIVLNSVIGNTDGVRIITANSGLWQGLVCRNSILLGRTHCSFGCSYFLHNVANSIFENCIFLDIATSGNFIGSSSCSFVGCLSNQSSNYFSPTSNLVSNCIVNQNKDSIFVQFQGNKFSIHDNFQLKLTSPGKNAGTDGKDVGIYGGASPWRDGGIPSNPHIYFKQVDANSSTDGKLKIQFKVRTNQ